MDHVELTPYPFPNGVKIPRLMPYQEFPWNGDGYLAAEVLRLKEAHGLKDAIETGTCLGSTTCWLAENFDLVQSCEINMTWMNIAMGRTSPWSGKVMLSCTDSVQFLRGHCPQGFYFLDAHWNEHCPLLDELDAIAAANIKPCIVIHDFQVPGHPEMGFDKMPDGRPFNLELIQSHCDRIYGEGKWEHWYPTEVAGAHRGWISIAPKP